MLKKYGKNIIALNLINVTRIIASGEGTKMQGQNLSKLSFLSQNNGSTN